MTTARKVMSLQTRMILLITVGIILIISSVGAVFSSIVASSIEEQIGKKALSVAKIVAHDPELRRAFQSSSPSALIQPIAENVRLQTGAEFVVVGNREGIRYAHPLPDRIGKSMVGGDNEPGLTHGQSYISKAIGSMGPSLRGKVPIRDDNGAVVGIVSVGFLLEDIEEAIGDYQKKVLLITLIALVCGIAFAIGLSRYLKRLTLGLEPEEIAALYVERNAVLESVREGIVAIDRNSEITMMNKAAIRILELPEEDIHRKHILDVLPDSRMPEVLKTGEQQLDRETITSGKEIIVNRLPIKLGDKVVGVVSSFRPKSEIDKLASELSQVRRYADVLRAQTHEFHNLLYTISGLLQLGSVQEAIELITSETSAQEELILFVARRIPDPMIGALLLGMHNRAKELKVQFVIDQDSHLEALPAHINRQQVIVLLGNLLQNALEAVNDAAVSQKRVDIYLADTEEELLFEIADSGPGVPDAWRETIFEDGFSTKAGEERGLGLAKVRGIIEEMGGYIVVGKSDYGGALFTVSLPREGRTGSEEA
ncbi:sensor histidine kinase [Brevibacillus agri]|uniref:histidine kinase n=2 Tax=Brevibacillus TaxID=55080 RepID=A0A3M8B0Q1_9BACL|nr:MULTISPECIES: sensor histidine kinase [Brevibacillus]ELK41837.1 two-component sensor histidine kinase [Brevibacillus agri BAB-2500]EJL45459.1 signal transduction histidine kinase regulating citrate/malate metabolism [Brevibacillus sp. CF112]MBG9565874.1 histidine kinase [Brevibacillus agri]MBY0052461.1 sensor histidine kinase [Brevibacillus agri]MCG5253149.1 sensor histidine kinase [Brevibacillus agri]